MVSVRRISKMRTQLRTLDFLENRLDGDPIKPGKVADVLDMTPQAIGKIFRELRDLGYVSTYEGKRRSYKISPSGIFEKRRLEEKIRKYETN